MTAAVVEAPADQAGAAPAFKRVVLKLACGFCAQGMHQRCPGVTSGPRGAKQVCPCWDADTEGGHQPVRCRECDSAESPLGDTLVCLDRTDCLLRIERRQADDPVHQMIVECYADRVTSDGETKPGKTPRQKREKAPQPKVAKACTCGCGGTTKGGAFLPGHDARFVSQLVAAGDVEAAKAALEPFPALLAKYAKRVVA